jgi:heme A synthase
LNKRLTFVRVTYWIGIIGDLITCIPLIFPEVAKYIFGVNSISVTNEYLYVSRIAASLMFGWTCLLFWAVLKPVERRGILLVTICPVMCGLVIAGIIAVTSGLIPAASMVPIWIFNGIIIIIFALAYYFALLLARKSG